MSRIGVVGDEPHPVGIANRASHVKGKRLKQALGGQPVRVAVVTDSVRVRFIVSTIALLNSKIRTFARADMRAAYRHLDLSLKEQRITRATLIQLEQL